MTARYGRTGKAAFNARIGRPLMRNCAQEKIRLNTRFEMKGAAN
jgi:hypothetical protein